MSDGIRRGALLVLLLAVLLPARRTGSVTVCCSGGGAATTYYYDLVGPGYVQTVRLDYDPADPSTLWQTVENVPLGVYRLLENGVERASLHLTYGASHRVVMPRETWPVMPAKGVMP